MRRTKRFVVISTLAAIGLVGSAVFGHYLYRSGNVAQCQSAAQYDSPLATGLPANNCLRSDSLGNTWLGWFSGHSRSVQFHFVDLLELLLGHSDSGNSGPTSSPSSGAGR